MVERSTEFVCIKALLGWDDASTDSAERLVTNAGSLGLIIGPKKTIEFFGIDRFSGETIQIRVTGPWSYGTINVLARHLEMVDILRGDH